MEYWIIQIKPFSPKKRNENIVLNFHIITNMYIIRNINILAYGTSFPNRGPFLDMTKMPDFCHISNAYIFINITTFMYIKTH